MAENKFHTLITGIASRQTNVKELQFLRDDSTRFTVTSLTGGSCNHVFKVTSADGAQSLIFKHAPDTVKQMLLATLVPVPFAVNLQENFDEWSLPTLRVDLDYYTLQKVDEACPGATPELYCLDTETHTAVMEFMDNSETLSQQLNRGHVDVKVARKIGEITAAFHKHTWCSLLSDEDRKQMIQLYNVEGLVKVKKDFDFDGGIDEDATWNKVEEENLKVFRELKADGFLEAHIKQLCEYHHGCKQCLIHNDYYSSSVMIHNGAIKVFDAEFANVGVGAMDMGIMISYYVMTYHKAQAQGKPDLANTALQATRALIEEYVTSMSTVMAEECEQKKLVQDITDFLGYSLVRSTIFAEVDMHIDLSPAVKVQCWKCGKRMMQQALEVTKIDDCIKLICFDV